MLIAELFKALSNEAVTRPYQTAVTSVLVSFLAYIIVNEYVARSTRLAAFDGPKRLPIVGNLHQLRSNAAEKYREWAKTYGPVYQIQLGNILILLVNSASAARTVFGTNSSATASRPEFYTFHKLVSNTAGTTIGTAPYSESLKRRRKGAASALNRPAVETYIPHLDLETKDFIAEAFKFGKGGKTEITHVEVEISRFRSTTDNLQDYIPLLRLNPFSFGHKKAAEYRNRRDAYLGMLNRDLEERVSKGTHKPCIQANIMLDREAKLNDVEMMSISLTMLSGGFETFSTVTTWAIAYLATHPEIQDKAYKAITDLHGSKSLCDPNDDQKCDYVRALVRETLTSKHRYFTVLRLSLPRATNKDFYYEGKFVPKGTVVFLNSWACNMDDELWEDPELFRPERWLEHPDHPMFTFGVGYRMCAGSLLANRELYLTFMRMIASFELSTRDEIDTNPLTGVEDLTSLVSTPRKYRVTFKPRNDAVLKAAIAQGFDE
ncbi:Isoflavone 2'-hydroxylase [Fusarium oxysporum f. sp. cubense race 1]|uniref:Isoflavone 2'-hydroxylase n=1 Tax=Fusarium oxysporum f. sp. cubense (strain race 1) TaxID=1229664 RepID=N4UAV3_FUSC1|nr:Isoflavone 2'-hydroxylase [Fusarium oxysporum f. sp. cubense race 1]